MQMDWCNKKLNYNKFPFLRMAALCKRTGCACLVQTLRLHAL